MALKGLYIKFKIYIDFSKSTHVTMAPKGFQLINNLEAFGIKHWIKSDTD